METPKPKYPPPITTLPFVMKRKCTSDGRLILTMEKPHDDDEDMKAHRSNDDDVNVSESATKTRKMEDLIDSSGSGERAFSRNGDDDENGCTSKDQSALLEESFKEHNTLNPELNGLVWLGILLNGETSDIVSGCFLVALFSPVVVSFRCGVRCFGGVFGLFVILSCLFSFLLAGFLASLCLFSFGVLFSGPFCPFLTWQIS
ncbi:hypothetical protein EZV62_013836 [Acer yangbiense]|uniref:FAF domain-containing protein n=1 Tax=Acer yangbiense TaxID=1000413 RepID=A0A5C7HQC0_9ROSI|nr:hypothetical protein EZV62_013836 [Acer yangbiense]